MLHNCTKYIVCYHGSKSCCKSQSPK